MPFPYNTALITGATSGIGYALAKRLIATNVFVVAVGRRRERLDKLVATHGPSEVAVEACDVSDLDGMAQWTKRYLCFPLLDSRLSFLPHLQSLSSPASIILVSSALGIVPLPRCANYCASKAALRSLAWSLRAQLSDDGQRSEHIRVIEIIPPAVKTELHTRQADLVAVGQVDFGIPLDQFIEETWLGLENGAADEISVGIAKVYAASETEKKKAFEGLLAMVKEQSGKV
ncbi:hypothetical protein TCE0_033r07889 [Talaromyces pinophilus]|uniref:Ketoreductase domain-containing protein n=1 Tax=Talaromyces pinophilus TaxID=128442 RepID=A0A6V8H8N6_TALPI|nr:hypothetical protein TCE0_033r07889 [Talaromyces pinophilus]